VRKWNLILEIFIYLFYYFKMPLGVRKQGCEEVEHHIRNIYLFILLFQDAFGGDGAAVRKWNIILEIFIYFIISRCLWGRWSSCEEVEHHIINI